MPGPLVQVVSAALSERKVACSIPTIGDFHTVGPCTKVAFPSLATDIKTQDIFSFTFISWHAIAIKWVQKTFSFALKTYSWCIVHVRDRNRERFG